MKSLNSCTRRMAVTFCLELLRAVTDELFLKDFVLVGDTAGLFLGLIALGSHRLHVLLQVHAALLEDLDLLAG